MGKNCMETGKLIVAILLIAGFFIFLPQVFSFAFSAFGEGSLGSGVFGSNSVGTLSEPESGRGGTLAVSYNGGENFEESAVHTGFQPEILDIDTYQKFYIAGTNRGLLVSRDGGLNWYPFTDLEKRIDSDTVIYDFVRGPNGALYIAAYKNNHGVIYTTNDTFFTATSIWEEAKMPVRAINADKGYLYAGLSDGRLLRYSFARGTFEKVADFQNGISDLVFAGAGNLFVGLDGGGVYTDNGTRARFTQLQTPTDDFFVSGGGLHLTNDSRTGSSIFMASVGGLFRSENGDSLWNEIDSILPTRAKIEALSVQNGSIFLTSEAKFYKSNDGGKSWKVSEPMPTTERFGTLYVENSGKTVIVGTRR